MALTVSRLTAHVASFCYQSFLLYEYAGFNPVLLGRGEDTYPLCLALREVRLLSGRHCQLFHFNGQLFIQDLRYGSSE